VKVIVKLYMGQLSDRRPYPVCMPGVAHASIKVSEDMSFSASTILFQNPQLVGYCFLLPNLVSFNDLDSFTV
jgi:hypothetical protein